MLLRSRLARSAMAAILLAFVAGCGEEPLTLQPQEPSIDSPAKLVETLIKAYQLRDYERFGALLANEPGHNAEYIFLLSEPSDRGETQWGYDEEARIHRRMFHPEKPLPGDLPVPDAVWLQSLSISLAALEPFAERLDLYSQDGGADGKLDPALWRVSGATYDANAFFDLAGDTDYRIEGRESFVVIENLAKNVGDPGKFLLLVWEDVRNTPRVSVASATWGQCKSLYR